MISEMFRASLSHGDGNQAETGAAAGFVDRNSDVVEISTTG
jgi:hypothetical protein